MKLLSKLMLTSSFALMISCGQSTASSSKASESPSEGTRFACEGRAYDSLAMTVKGSSASDIKLAFISRLFRGAELTTVEGAKIKISSNYTLAKMSDLAVAASDAGSSSISGKKIKTTFTGFNNAKSDIEFDQISFTHSATDANGFSHLEGIIVQGDNKISLNMDCYIPQ